MLLPVLFILVSISLSIIGSAFAQPNNSISQEGDGVNEASHSERSSHQDNSST